MRPKLRSPSMILGIALVVVGVTISVIAIWKASGLPTSGSAQIHIVSGFHPTALLPGVFPNYDPITSYSNQLYHIALYSEVVTVVGVALIVDAFLGNPFSRMDNLFLKRARISVFLGKVRSEKARLYSLGRKRGFFARKRDSEDKESVDKKLRDLRRFEISLETDLRDIDWKIREAGEVSAAQVAASPITQESLKKRTPIKEKILRFLETNFEFSKKHQSKLIRQRKEEKKKRKEVGS